MYHLNVTLLTPVSLLKWLNRDFVLPLIEIASSCIYFGDIEAFVFDEISGNSVSQNIYEVVLNGTTEPNGTMVLFMHQFQLVFSVFRLQCM